MNFDKISIGIDIVMIERFKKKPYISNENFYKKIFHDSEITYCLNKINAYQSFAGKFAIKEAVIKSINIKMGFLDILTEHANSKPIVKLINNSSFDFKVSVSHEKNYAIAIVLCNEKIPSIV